MATEYNIQITRNKIDGKMSILEGAKIKEDSKIGAVIDENNFGEQSFFSILENSSSVLEEIKQASQRLDKESVEYSEIQEILIADKKDEGFMKKILSYVEKYSQGLIAEVIRRNS